MLLGNILSHLPREPKPPSDSWTRRTDGDMGSVADEDEYEEEAIRDAVSRLHQRTFKSYKNWATKMAELSRSQAFGVQREDTVERQIHEIMLWWCVPALTSRRRSRPGPRQPPPSHRAARARQVRVGRGGEHALHARVHLLCLPRVRRACPRPIPLGARWLASALPAPLSLRPPVRVHACRSSCRCRRRGGRRAGGVGTTWTR